MTTLPSAPAVSDQNETTGTDTDVHDIHCMLNELNLDALIAGLDAEPEAVPPSPAQTIQGSTPDTDDRRVSRRLSAKELPKEVRLTIPGASQTTLVNISETGVLVETTRRLCPGKTTDVFVRYDGERRPMRVTIIRSTLHSLVPVPVYRTALHFDRALPLAV